MAAATPQNFSNHTRLDPFFHFFVMPVFAITLIATIVHLVFRGAGCPHLRRRRRHFQNPPLRSQGARPRHPA